VLRYPLWSGLDGLLHGAVAQLGERWLCKPEVVGSIPISSTRVARPKQDFGPHRVGHPFSDNFIATWAKALGVYRPRPARSARMAERIVPGTYDRDDRLSIASSRVIAALAYRAPRTSSTCALGIGQARKGVRWMPRRREAKKDVDSCDKLRGAANKL
jgi:hypothetical protein